MNKVLQPIINNIPLFIISILLLGGFDVAYQQYLFHEIDTVGIVMAYGEIIITATLICYISWVLRKLHLKVFFYIFLFIIYTINLYLTYAYSTDITPNILLILSETNNKEVSGFFSTIISGTATFKTIFAVSILLILTIIGEIHNAKIKKIAEKPIYKCIVLSFLLFGIICGVSTFKRYWDLANYKDPYDSERWILGKAYFSKRMPITNLVYSVNALILSSLELNQMVEVTEASLSDVDLKDSDSLNIVLVIGESYNKYHSQLYGYSLNTTPFQYEEFTKGNLHKFTNIKAPHNMTSVVLKNVLCCNDVHENERWFDAPFFPAIFKKAGYGVWLWDNQYQQDHNYPWNFTLNSIMFNDTVKQLSYTSINDKGFQFDDDLIFNFEKNELSKLGKHNLIVFHLWGQHLPADAQFPKNSKYNIFSIKDIKNKATYLNNDSRQVIADYDNATYYNDQVISHIVNIFKDKNTILIYFPDHGEEIYDYQDSCGRQVFGEVEITPQNIKYQLEIPFTIWASETWKRKHEPEWMTMGEYTDRAFTTDNICHMLFRLAGINTKAYNNKRDLLDQDFIPQTKEYDIVSL